MSETKHTPGPWKVIEGTYGGYNIEPNVIELESDGGCGDPECCGSPSYEVCIPNKWDARLIAAAPETAAERDRLLAINAEMLAALKAIVGLYDSTEGYILDGEIDAARVAIAKAEGR